MEPFADSLEQILTALSYIDWRVRWAVRQAEISQSGVEDDQFRGLFVASDQVARLTEQPLGADKPEGEDTEIEADEADYWTHEILRQQQMFHERSSLSFEQGQDLLLNRIVRSFQLTSTELDIFLVALVADIDTRYEYLFSFLQDDVTKKRPSVDLILNLLSDSFQHKLELRHHFTATATLIRNNLVQLAPHSHTTNPTLLSQQVVVPPHIFEHLSGTRSIDPQIQNLIHFDPAPTPSENSFHSSELLERLYAVADDEPILAFVGEYGSGKLEAAQKLAMHQGRSLIRVDLVQLRESELGLTDTLKLIIRDGILHNANLYLSNWDQFLNQDYQPPAGLLDLILSYPSVVVTNGKNQWYPIARRDSRGILSIHFSEPSFQDRLSIWRAAVGNENINIEGVATHFRFTAGQIADAVASAKDIAQWEGKELDADILLGASRSHSNQRLATLATKIVPRYRWSDIVLPQDTMAQLYEMVNTVIKRPQVYNEWGFGDKLALGKGVNALFAGDPGTGKTMSADIIANELGLDLYKIDLSTVVDKYIGETEKNISKIFDEATTSNAILFFDEADTLFSKRSEVKDSHDRHANIQVGYLLQRMEAFDGIVILATNLKANIDEAFMRRLHFAIEFPFPQPEDRTRIWKVMFPPNTPIDTSVDFTLLSERFRLAGGAIRNIVLASSFLAAQDNVPVNMNHLLHASRREYQKMGRLINEKLFVLPPSSSNNNGVSLPKRQM